MRRRDLLKSAVLGTAGLVAGSGRLARAAPSAAPIANLGVTAAAAGITFGSAFDREALDHPDYGELIRTHARILTTDFSFKFLPIRANGPEPDFTNADRLVAFAEAAKIPLRGHTLVWNDGNPLWVTKLSQERRIYWMERHMTEMMERYAGRLHSWDVVNEPFWPGHGNRGGWRSGPWYDAMGPAYVPRAYALAAKLDPKAKLVLNEAFTEGNTEMGRVVRAGLLKLVDDIKGKGLRLDAVGLQTHIRPNEPFVADIWRKFLADLAARDVDIYLTELDVDDRIWQGDDAARDQKVAETYRAVLDCALDEPRVTTVITWELADRFSSYVDIYGPTTRCLPFDRELRPKPAFDAMVAAFRAHKQR